MAFILRNTSRVLGVTQHLCTRALSLQSYKLIGREHKVFVANLPWSATEDDLYNTFEQFGNVRNATIIMDRETGRSRGYGFIEYDNTECAQKAITGANGAVLHGRDIYCNA